MARPSLRAVAVRFSLVGLLAAACSAGAGAPHHSAPPAVPTTAPVAPGTGPATTATTTATTEPPTDRVAVTTTTVATPTGVGTTTLAVVDRTRPTVQYGRTLSPVRSLPTVVRYPAVGPQGAVESTDAPGASGRWPLVVFAHGYNRSPATYAHLLHAWAAAGFVVAAPSFPLETQGGPLDENDLNNEPQDISVVITAVLSQSSGPLAHLIDPSRIAVTGHSDGAEAALAAGFVDGDTRIGPVISMAAQGIIGGPSRDPQHPLLVVQGTEDTINPPARGDAVYAAAGPPKYYLRLLGAGHEPPIVFDTPWRPIVEQVTIDFLRRHLNGSVAASVLVADGTRSGLSTLTADP